MFDWSCLAITVLSKNNSRGNCSPSLTIRTSASPMPGPSTNSDADAAIMTAAVLSSRERGIWPFSRASLRRFGVARSVRSWNCSSAMS